MRYSFTPSGDWFVFEAKTGNTIRLGFPSAKDASAWIISRMARANSMAA